VLAALIIVFREVFEAGLIVGIVLAVTRSVPHRNTMDRAACWRRACGRAVSRCLPARCQNLFAEWARLFNAVILCVAS